MHPDSHGEAASPFDAAIPAHDADDREWRRETRSAMETTLGPSSVASFERALDGHPAPDEAAVHAAWRTLDTALQNVGPQHHGRFHQLPTRRPQWMRRMVWGIIASAAVVTTVILGTRSGWLLGSSGTSHVAQHYRALPGQRRTVHLPDGATMILAPSTTATASASGIEVDGEAYFAVTGRPSRPFIVRTRNATVRVLGTRFVVRQYHDEARSQVMVEEGRTAVQRTPVGRDTTPAVVASPNTLIVVSDSETSVTPGVAAREYTTWTTGTLVFRGVPLRDIVADLGRAYDADIRVDDAALGKRALVLEISTSTQSISQVLDLIAFALDAHYTRQDGTYRVVPGHTTPAPTPRRPSSTQEKHYGR